MKREQKLCSICDKPIYRGKYVRDYNWKITKNCSTICQNLSSAIIRLTAMGYTITKPIASSPQETQTE